jgi:hypothetical protein
MGSKICLIVPSYENMSGKYCFYSSMYYKCELIGDGLEIH